jgi:7-cyano-7-deazaguanine synthase
MNHADPAALAVLISGGVDSAVLLGESLRQLPAVQPLYVRTGLSWETTELEHLQRFMQAVAAPALRPLHVLELPVADLYGRHWSLTGEEVPDAASPDEAVFLPGRNVLLLAKTLLWCHLHRVPALALAVLAGNPFPDATPAFFAAYAGAVNQAVGGAVRVLRPYAALSKTQVLERGRHLPLERTFSCIHPIAGRHCGACNKCAERRRAFAAAGLADRTVYHSEGPCTA